MQISSMSIDNFKSVRHLTIESMENACIFVGKNNTGKTVVLDAIRAVAGIYNIRDENFNDPEKNIEISITLDFDEEDLELFRERGIVSRYRKPEEWR